MRDDERVNLQAPEQVEVTYELAGLGSRFIAAVVDLAIVALIVILLALSAWIIRMRLSGQTEVAGVTAIIVLASSLLVYIAYYVYYEVAVEGKTPGKNQAGLRVISTDGGSISFEQAAVRNILRIVDMLPISYAAGAISILVSARNQRLGDLASGAMVVKERLEESLPELPPEPEHSAPAAPLPPEVSEDLLRVVRASVRAVTREEEKTIRRFLNRRFELAPAARRRLATRLTDALRRRFPGLDPGQLANPETFLEVIIRAIDTAR
ncbi:MAG: RDD family protein [candidate division WS1 bacterium]|jgi:uncharacterized RDD family membrane protein YckC|nr:RDD family protein [candidate division WS1 bacterium]